MGFLSSQGKKSHLFVVILFCFDYTCCVEKPTVILNTVAFSQAVVLFCIVSSLFNLFFKKNDIQCFLNIFTPSSFQILLTLLCTMFFFFNPQNTFCLLMQFCIWGLLLNMINLVDMAPLRRTEYPPSSSLVWGKASYLHLSPCRNFI